MGIDLEITNKITIDEMKMDVQEFSVPFQIKTTKLKDSLRKASKKIAPVWPLENFVAVNPYLGLTDKKFDSVAQLLSSLGGIQMTLPLSFYKQKFHEGIIKYEDLNRVFQKKTLFWSDLDDFIHQLEQANDSEKSYTGVATLIDVATQSSDQDWGRFASSRISSLAASYYDRGQTIWNTVNQGNGFFKAWKTDAEIDLTPEIHGLKGFRNFVTSLPKDPIKAAEKAIEILDIPDQILDAYLHRLLIRFGGWSAHAARIDWDSELYGGKDGEVIQFLSVLICWEAALLHCLDSSELQVLWSIAKKKIFKISRDTEVCRELNRKLILQEAFDMAMQRELLDKINLSKKSIPAQRKRPKAQAIFCIDVRSEVFRRNLEHSDSEIETIGFAGFFAFPINFIPIAHESGEAQCPVLIPTGPTIKEEIPDENLHRSVYNKRIIKNQFKQVWKSFKSGAVSCFSFVSPLGISYLPKLFTDSFGITQPVSNLDKVDSKKKPNKQRTISLEQSIHNDQITGIPLVQRVEMAKNALNAMSLTQNFARFVLINGHGSSTVNNPHATGLDCGACGGRSGEANAKVAAAVLNDSDVRRMLIVENIFIPDDTVFLACLHDTTTDEISIFNRQDVPLQQIDELKDLEESLKSAGKATRAERSLRMNTTGNIDKSVISRSKDWSQVRPEWGLAGCYAFVVAPRDRTKDLNLEGKSFLHSYDWKKDTDFSILELIMTAPMVVTSWINLQYYASAADNKNFGSGNKTLHNVTSGIGVLEGHSGDLRVGLPIQSVHDGENYQHEPVRLNVIIEAPIESMNSILEKHKSVRNLCDNGWIHLLAMNEEGNVSHRYLGNLSWESLLN